MIDESARDGLVLGASLGFGFATFESVGGALTAMSPSTVFCAGPAHHRTTAWVAGPVRPRPVDAILGGVLFSRGTREHFLISGRLLAAYVGVSLLHALRDPMNSIAVLITLVLTEQPWQRQLLALGYLPQPTATRMLFTVHTWLGLALITVVAPSWLAALAWASPDSTAPPTRGYRVSTQARW